MDPEPGPHSPEAGGGGHVWYRGYGWWEGHRGFPWLGLLLVALGAALVIEEIEGRIDTSHSLALLAGVVFSASFALGRSGWAGLPAALLTGWGLTRVLQDLGYIAGSGWTALLVGAAFLAVYLIGLARHGGRHGWALWLGLALVTLGAAQIAVREIPGLPPLDAYVLPVTLIVIGMFLVLRARRLRTG